MKNKLTIIKVLANDENPSKEDIEKWREIFALHKMTEEEARNTGEVFIEYVPVPAEDEENNHITLIKVGDTNYHPTVQDIEQWRAIFEEAKGDPDFKIFTHPNVQIEVIEIGKIIAVE